MNEKEIRIALRLLRIVLKIVIDCLEKRLPEKQ